MQGYAPTYQVKWLAEILEKADKYDVLMLKKKVNIKIDEGHYIFSANTLNEIGGELEGREVIFLVRAR